MHKIDFSCCALIFLSSYYHYHFLTLLSSLYCAFWSWSFFPLSTPTLSFIAANPSHFPLVFSHQYVGNSVCLCLLSTLIPLSPSVVLPRLPFAAGLKWSFMQVSHGGSYTHYRMSPLILMQHRPLYHTRTKATHARCHIDMCSRIYIFKHFGSAVKLCMYTTALFLLVTDVWV